MVTVGETANFTTSILPDNATDKSGKWSTSDTAIATVSGGTVTAKAAGEVDVTFTTNDGGKTATGHLTVNATS